jgi:N-carbamoyl-L-amino-acid hydrolase
MEMAKIGPGVAGGNNRQTLTDEDAEGRALFQILVRGGGHDHGRRHHGQHVCAPRGNQDPDALPVYVGSHLDTQPTGGKYDGVLGVLGGLEMIRSLNDLGIKTKHPIVVTNWTNEEGTRFAPAMLASGVFAGKHKQDWAYDRVDAEGKRFGDELRASAGSATRRWARARCTRSSSCISNRGRSWRPRARMSASSPTAKACAGSNAR